MAEYKVAFIGCGGRARAHAPAVKAEPRCHVVAAVDPAATAAQALVTEYGFADAALYADHRAMLDDQKPEAVVLSLWTKLHLPVFRDCVEAGVRAVLCEKPMAPTWRECVEMAALAEQAKVQLTFCHQRRFAPGNRQVRRWIGEGRFGTILRMDLTSPQHLLDCGTHTIDQAMSFNAERPARWVMAGTDVTDPIRYFDLQGDVLTCGTVVFDNGVRAGLQCGGPDLDVWGGVRVIGDEGFAEVTWNGHVRRAVRYDDPAWRPTVPEDPAAEQTAMAAMVRDTFDCLDTGRPSELSSAATLRVMETLFALYESARARRRIELPLTGVTGNPFHDLVAAAAETDAQSD